VIGGTVTNTRHAPAFNLRLILMSKTVEVRGNGNGSLTEQAPRQTIENPVAPISTDEHQKLELQLRLVKDEIAAQANTFDQIDSKTGVALGFTFVVVGQVLAAVFRMATDNNAFHNKISHISDGLFIAANVFAFLAIVFGAIARWPREFEHSINFSQDELSLPYLAMLQAASKSFTGRVKENETRIKTKGRWATITYLFVGLALVIYLFLTMVLYFF
jgi:hypothetical protein